jgi:cargo-transport protein YPP1
LFTVHASLAEFDLAFKAFDTYVEIITRAKDREERSEEEDEEDSSFDDDDTVIRTAAEAVRNLCRFGSRKEVEKARDIGRTLEKWLKVHIPASTATAQALGHSRSNTVESVRAPSSSNATPAALSIALRAIGISRATWARVTYDAPLRSKIQGEAVQYLEKSLDPYYGDPYNIESHYALGLVLAEMRDIAGAIKVIKRALSQSSPTESTLSPDGVASTTHSVLSQGDYIRERKLIPLWHLLALLLTARSDFFTASKACEAAFEQFHNSTILFGQPEDAPLYRSEHLNAIPDSNDHRKKGLVDRMEAFEKEGIIQIKLTQLALVETMDGSTAAIEGADELLALYGRLFSESKTPQPKLQPPSTAQAPPKSKGSIFRRPKTSAKNVGKNLVGAKSPESETAPTTTTQSTVPPAIQVTDEDAGSRSAISARPSRAASRKDQSPHRSASHKLKKKSISSLHEVDGTQNGATSAAIPEMPSLNGASRSRANSASGKHKHSRSASSSFMQTAPSAEQPLRKIAHNMPHNDEPPPPGHSAQPPKQDVRLPAPFPGSGYHSSSVEPRFSLLQEKRHRWSLLIEVWLFIATLYKNAGMYADAQEAIDEGTKLVEQLEVEVLQSSGSSSAMGDKGWGGGKSVEELWGDVMAAVSLKSPFPFLFNRICALLEPV